MKIIIVIVKGVITIITITIIIITIITIIIIDYKSNIIFTCAMEFQR